MSDWWGSIYSANPVVGQGGWWCGDLPPPGAITTFNYNQFTLSFPELSYLSQAQLQQYWNLAQYFVANNGQRGAIANSALQSTALNFATAHLVKLFANDVNGNPPSGLVGRVSHAAEGTVNVAAEWGSTVSDAEAWWIQTQYGAAFWNCTRAMRTFHYMRGNPRIQDPWRWRY